MAGPGPLLFRTRGKGIQALARAVNHARTRTVVICPEPYLSDIYGAFKCLAEPDREIFFPGLGGGKPAFRSVFRSAMETCPSVFLCGEADGFHVREASRKMEHLGIPGGLVLVCPVAPDSPRQGPDGTGGPGQIPEPAGPGDIYSRYCQAADLAAGQGRLVYLRVADRLWGEKEGTAPEAGIIREAADLPAKGRARICRECPHRELVTEVQRILAARDIFITAMACQGPGLESSPVIGRPLPPVQGCAASGIWIETSDGNLVVHVGGDDLGPDRLDKMARELGAERIFRCQPSCLDNLVSTIKDAAAWQGGAAVLACLPLNPYPGDCGRGCHLSMGQK